MNGVNKYVIETSGEILVASVGDSSTGKLVAETETDVNVVSYFNAFSLSKMAESGNFSQGRREVI